MTARAEEAIPARREQYDIATARAVARLPMLCELCLPFVKVGGLFLAMKGESAADEVQEAQTRCVSWARRWNGSMSTPWRTPFTGLSSSEKRAPPRRAIHAPLQKSKKHPFKINSGQGRNFFVLPVR